MGTVETRGDAVEIAWEPLRQPPQKLVFEPRSDGDWLRIEKRWNGCEWVWVGDEIVNNVTVTGPAVST